MEVKKPMALPLSGFSSSSFCTLLGGGGRGWPRRASRCDSETKRRQPFESTPRANPDPALHPGRWHLRKSRDCPCPRRWAMENQHVAPEKLEKNTGSILLSGASMNRGFDFRAAGILEGSFQSTKQCIHMHRKGVG